MTAMKTKLVKVNSAVYMIDVRPEKLARTSIFFFFFF